MEPGRLAMGCRPTRNCRRGRGLVTRLGSRLTASTTPLVQPSLRILFRLHEAHERQATHIPGRMAEREAGQLRCTAAGRAADLWPPEKVRKRGQSRRPHAEDDHHLPDVWPTLYSSLRNAPVLLLSFGAEQLPSRRSHHLDGGPSASTYTC